MVDEDRVVPFLVSRTGQFLVIVEQEGKETIMADILTGFVQDGVIVLDPVPGRPMPPDGTRVRVEITGPSASHDREPDPLARTRAFLLAAAREAEANAPPLPPDLAEDHDRYAHGNPP
jgi:hypothetical protein